MGAKEKNSFLLYKVDYGAVKDFTDVQLGKLFRAIYEFQLGGDYQQFLTDPFLQMAFKFFESKFEADNNKYENTCNQRAKAGSQGGKQKQANLEKRQSVPKVANAKIATNVPKVAKLADMICNDMLCNDKNRDINIDFLFFSDKKNIFQKFFLRNLKNPDREVERFYEYNKSKGWVFRNGQPIKSAISASNLWKPEDETPRFPEEAVELFKIAYKRAENEQEREDICKVSGARISGGELLIYVPSERVFQTIDKHLTPKDNPKNLVVKYQMIKEN